MELSDREGYDKNNNLTWKGTSFGFEIEFTIGISLPGEKENVKVYTELTFPVLDKNSETYKTLDKKPYK
ncbi:MAG: hypothetical protein GXO50_01725 [Chlorobi bacterium]|nr:hypothetical protein [Chlorobiota bacterium]